MRNKKILIFTIIFSITIIIIMHNHKPHPLSRLISKASASLQMDTWTPVSIKPQISSHYKNDEKIFLDALMLGKKAFFSYSKDRNRKLIIIDIEPSIFDILIYSSKSCRFIFSINNNGIFFIDASVTERMI